MKKKFCWALCLLLVFSFVGCAAPAVPDDNAAPPEDTGPLFQNIAGEYSCQPEYDIIAQNELGFYDLLDVPESNTSEIVFYNAATMEKDYLLNPAGEVATVPDRLGGCGILTAGEYIVVLQFGMPAYEGSDHPDGLPPQFHVFQTDGLFLGSFALPGNGEAFSWNSQIGYGNNALYFIAEAEGSQLYRFDLAARKLEVLLVLPEPELGAYRIVQSFEQGFVLQQGYTISEGAGIGSPLGLALYFVEDNRLLELGTVAENIYSAAFDESGYVYYSGVDNMLSSYNPATGETKKLLDYSMFSEGVVGGYISRVYDNKLLLYVWVSQDEAAKPGAEFESEEFVYDLATGQVSDSVPLVYGNQTVTIWGERGDQFLLYAGTRYYGWRPVPIWLLADKADYWNGTANFTEFRDNIFG